MQFNPPAGLTEEQCKPIRAYVGRIPGPSSIEGQPIVVTAWTPTLQEIEDLVSGKPVYLTLLAKSLPPHVLTTDFHKATHLQ